MVEPWFDRRADADEDMALHLESCAACRATLASLEQLRAELGATLEPPNAFVMKRLRHGVLTRASGGSSTVRPTPKRLWVLAAMAATLLFGALGLALWIGRAGDAMTLTPSTGARFTTEDREGLRIVRIDDGSFAFDVRHHEDGRRLLVVVPDGEIEDIGTRFSVVVHDGVTTEIGVLEGEVEFRRKGAAPVRLIAGMTYRPWSPETTAVASGTAPKLAVAPPSSEPATAASSAAASAATPVPLAAAPSAAPPRVAAATPRSDGATAAARSHSATSGANPKAAAHVSPTRAAPGEPPSSTPSAGPTQHGPTLEDAAYMRVIRLLRAGSTDEARTAARAYLDSFPEGLRKREIEAVAAGR